MGRSKEKAINKGLENLGHFAYNFLIFIIVGASVLTRLDFNNNNEWWPTDPNFYNLNLNNKLQSGGKRKKQRGGFKTTFPYSLDDPDSNGLMRYIGNFFKYDWYNFRKVMSIFINLEFIKNNLSIDTSNSLENTSMWLLWNSITFKNIGKTMALILYFTMIVPFISIFVALGTSLWSIFANPFITAYKPKKLTKLEKQAGKEEDSSIPYFIALIVAFWGMFISGCGIWSLSLMCQILFLFVYLVIMPIISHTSRWKDHVVNLLNFRPSDDGEYKKHNVLKLFMVFLLITISIFSSADWFTYNPIVMGILIGVEVMSLALYLYYQ
jgi:hypothetical protein